LTRFILVRHGTTEWVDSYILHGITDIPLNQKGLDQARQAADALAGIKANHLYTSPLTRCVQTADIIAERLGVQPILLEGLKELDFGYWEGRPFRDHSMQDYNVFYRFVDKYLRQIIRSLTGESHKKFKRRVLQALGYMLDENPHGTVLVVGHSAVFNTILINYLGEHFPEGKSYFVMRPGSLNELEVESLQKGRLVRMNDISHQV